MFPVLNIGPLALQTPGLILLIGIWISLLVAEKQASRFKVSSAILYNLVLIGLLSGLLGARLTYAARYPSAFADDPLGILSLTPTMLDPAGGFLVAAVAMLIYGQRKGCALFPVLDALTPFFMVVMIFNALANLASGNAYGVPTRMPWGFELWGAFRHPSQVYELVSALIILGLVWRVRKAKDPNGMTFFRFLALAAVSRLFLEAYRGDSIMLLGSIRLGQVVAWALLWVALWQLGKLIRQQDKENHEPER